MPIFGLLTHPLAVGRGRGATKAVRPLLLLLKVESSLRRRKKTPVHKKWQKLNNMSKNAETFRKDFDGKDTTTGTVKARKKVENFFLSSFTLVIQ